MVIRKLFKGNDVKENAPAKNVSFETLIGTPTHRKTLSPPGQDMDSISLAMDCLGSNES